MNSQHELSAFIAESAAALRIADVPEAALDIARGGIADCLGVLVAGCAEPPALIMRAVAADGGTEASLLPDGAPASARAAALINGVAAHVLDFDDVAMDSHPTAVLLPALLAEAEATGAGCGRLLAGYIAGYETWAVLRATARAPLHGVGWHPSGVFGAVAAAVSCAVLRGLNADGVARAMGLGAAQASGVLANFGTGAKSFQTARAAESGLLAARLADAGMTANRKMFDRDGDFARLFAGGSSSRPVAAFGAPAWAILTTPLSIKVYPICYAAHRLIDAALALHEAGGFRPEDVERIEALLSEVSSGILYSRIPDDALAAKFSAEFVVAAGLLHGAVTSAELAPAALHDPRLRQLMAKVTRVTTEAVGDDPPHAPFDKVILHLRDGGTRHSPDIVHPSGSPFRPVTRAQAAQKFLLNTGAAMDPAAAAVWFDRIWTMAAGDPLGQILPVRAFIERV